MDLNKIKLERLDPLGQVLETIELDGRWAITISDKIYFMTSDYIEEIKIWDGKQPLYGVTPFGMLQK